jgi:hypothetical protein
MVFGLAIPLLPCRYRGDFGLQHYITVFNLRKKKRGGKIFLPNDKIFTEMGFWAEGGNWADGGTWQTASGQGFFGKRFSVPD